MYIGTNIFLTKLWIISNNSPLFSGSVDKVSLLNIRNEHRANFIHIKIPFLWSHVEIYNDIRESLQAINTLKAM